MGLHDFNINSAYALFSELYILSYSFISEAWLSFHHFSLNFVDYVKMFLNKVCCMASMTAPVLNCLSLRFTNLTVYGCDASAGGTYRFTVILSILERAFDCVLTQD